MTDDLGTLRPEVRGALERMIVLCSAANKTGKWMRADCDTVIIAELLRLAKAEFELMLALQDRLGVQDEYAVVAKGWQERAERAEAELAALKARIAEAPVATLVISSAAGDLTLVWAENPDDWASKRVRLVVEE